MNENNGTARCFGYARASSSTQVLSTEMQEDLIRKKAETIQDAKWVHCRVDQAVSATKTRWNDKKRRPQYGILMDEMQQGDHLIIWRLDRLERSPFGMVQALDWLVRRGVNVHIIQHGEMQLDLDTAIGKMVVMLLAGYAGFFSEQLSQTIKRTHAWRKERGLATNWPQLGHTHKRQSIPGVKKKQLVEVWDAKQCELIREIVRRYESGESFNVIATDFHERRETWYKQYLWCPNVKMKRRRTMGRRLWQAYWWHIERLSRGLDLFDVPCSKEAQEKAKQRLVSHPRAYGPRKHAFRRRPIEPFEPY